MTTPTLITWRDPFSKAEHRERLAAAEKQLVDATNGLGGDLQVHVDDTIYHLRLARVVPGQPLWGMVAGAWGTTPPCEPPRAVLAMPLVKLPPEVEVEAAPRVIFPAPRVSTRTTSGSCGSTSPALRTGRS